LRHSSKVGTELWMAREILLADQNADQKDEEYTYPYSRESDTWSYGMVMYEILCKKLPFKDDQQAIFDLRNKKRPAITKEVQDDNKLRNLVRLMKACWEENPDERPSMGAIRISLYAELNDSDQWWRKKLGRELYKEPEEEFDFEKLEKERDMPNDYRPRQDAVNSNN